MKSYKDCRRCGKDYATEQLFISMTSFVGIQKFAPYNLLSLELRNCSCGTTLARMLPPGGVEAQLTPAIALA